MSDFTRNHNPFPFFSHEAPPSKGVRDFNPRRKETDTDTTCHGHVDTSFLQRLEHRDIVVSSFKANFCIIAREFLILLSNYEETNQQSLYKHPWNF